MGVKVKDPHCVYKRRVFQGMEVLKEIYDCCPLLGGQISRVMLIRKGLEVQGEGEGLNTVHKCAPVPNIEPVPNTMPHSDPHRCTCSLLDNILKFILEGSEASSAMMILPFLSNLAKANEEFKLAYYVSCHANYGYIVDNYESLYEESLRQAFITVMLECRNLPHLPREYIPAYSDPQILGEVLSTICGSIRSFGLLPQLEESNKQLFAIMITFTQYALTNRDYVDYLFRETQFLEEVMEASLALQFLNSVQYGATQTMSIIPEVLAGEFYINRLFLHLITEFKGEILHQKAVNTKILLLYKRLFEQEIFPKYEEEMREKVYLTIPINRYFTLILVKLLYTKTSVKMTPIENSIENIKVYLQETMNFCREEDLYKFLDNIFVITLNSVQYINELEGDIWRSGGNINHERLLGIYRLGNGFTQNINKALLQIILALSPSASAILTQWIVDTYTQTLTNLPLPSTSKYIESKILYIAGLLSDDTSLPLLYLSFQEVSSTSTHFEEFIPNVYQFVIWREAISYILEKNTLFFNLKDIEDMLSPSLKIPECEDLIRTLCTQKETPHGGKKGYTLSKTTGINYLNIFNSSGNLVKFSNIEEALANYIKTENISIGYDIFGSESPNIAQPPPEFSIYNTLIKHNLLSSGFLRIISGMFLASDEYSSMYLDLCLIKIIGDLSFGTEEGDRRQQLMSISQPLSNKLRIFMGENGRYGSGIGRLIRIISGTQSFGNDLSISQPPIPELGANIPIKEEGISKAERTKIAQEKVLARFAAQREAFMKKQGGMGVHVDIAPKNVEEEIKEEIVREIGNKMCCICKNIIDESLSAINLTPFGRMCYIETSNIIYHALRQTSLDLSKKYGLVGVELSESFIQGKWVPKRMGEFGEMGSEVIPNSCGHFAHYDCLNSYFSTTGKSTVGYNCPMCKAIANSFLPVVKLGILEPTNQLKTAITCFFTDLSWRQDNILSKNNDRLTLAQPSALWIDRFVNMVYYVAESCAISDVQEYEKSGIIELLQSSYNSLIIIISTYQNQTLSLKLDNPFQIIKEPLIAILTNEIILLSQQIHKSKDFKGFISLQQGDLNSILGTYLIQITLKYYLINRNIQEYNLSEELEKINIRQSCQEMFRDSHSEELVLNDFLHGIKKIYFILRIMREELLSISQIINSNPQLTTKEIIKAILTQIFPSEAQSTLEELSLLQIEHIGEANIKDIFLQYILTPGQKTPKTELNEIAKHNLLGFYLQTSVWNFKLISLELRYDQQYLREYKRKCNNCKSKNKSKALCLICGEILCMNAHCCRFKLGPNTVGELTYHAFDCSNGLGLFLHLLDGKILLISVHNNGTIYKPPYYDEFGENILALMKRRKNINITSKFLVKYMLRESKYGELQKALLGGSIQRLIEYEIQKTGNAIISSDI